MDQHRTFKIISPLPGDPVYSAYVGGLWMVWLACNWFVGLLRVVWLVCGWFGVLKLTFYYQVRLKTTSSQILHNDISISN